ncbi:MAG TPA: XdhC family protein [Bacteroidales bacterium]|nr:XdhC family protein [Bacteroidales bacterium]
MADILFELSEIHKHGKPFVLCIVTETFGSTPRKEGARMIVFDDGSSKGTIGGGSVEFQAINDAIKILETRKPIKKKFELEDDLQMHCGGNMEIYFEPFYPDLKLYVFGAGHVGREVGKYAKDFGFQVVFVDHRKDIFKEFENSYATCIAKDYFESLNDIRFDKRDFVVITTPKHEFDENLIGVIGKESLAYLGMIGSKRKVNEARKRLLENNILTEDQLDFVDMPIGIPFNAETPAEIAISIVAKLIDTKNKLSL